MNIIKWKTGANAPQKQRAYGFPIFSLQDEMNRLFDDFLDTSGSLPSTWGNQNGQSPTIDVSETDKVYKVKAELPGVESDHLDVTCDDGYLTIKGEKKMEKEEKEENYLRRESYYGTFQRSLALPDNADSDKADANFKNGILTITIPKRSGESSKGRKLTIKNG